MKEKTEKKAKMKIDKGRIAARIIAAIMVAFMLIASCSTLIYYIVK